MISPAAAEALRRQLREKMNDAADYVATGSCKSYEEYKAVCGKIEGLALAERALLDMVEAQEKADERS